MQSTAAKFHRLGHTIINSAIEADIVVINSCAVTAEAERKSRKAIRKIYRDNPQAKVVVTGCYAALKPEEVANKIGADLVVDNSNKDQLADIVDNELLPNSISVNSVETNDTVLFKRGMDRAFVKIQDGCRYSCAYCVVTIARGDERSRPENEIIDEINSLITQGINEVVLTGVHIGGYGSDTNSNLSTIVNHVLSETDIPRLRLSSLEPWDLSDDLFTLFKNDRLMPHLHLPAQSGSDAVLKRMRRRTTAQELLKKIEYARSNVKDIEITTDIIVGFPGETDQEWQETINFCKEANFSHIHTFAFSSRPLTKAAEMDNQIAKEIIKERSKELSIIATESKKAVLSKYIGRTLPVLWESKKEFASPGSNEGMRNTPENSEALFSGYTPNFLRVKANRNNIQKGTISDIIIVDIDGDELVGNN